jgi:hypothetical protein
MKDGGIAALYGNLAPDGCVVKVSAINPKMLIHTGPARVFDSEGPCLDAFDENKIKPGDVIIIRYEGPKGGPGMREMLAPTSAIVGVGRDRDVALLTDGRFSGGSRGAAIGHISPEALEMLIQYSWPGNAHSRSNIGVRVMDKRTCLDPPCGAYHNDPATGPPLCLAVRESKDNETAVIETQAFNAREDDRRRKLRRP